MAKRALLVAVVGGAAGCGPGGHAPAIDAPPTWWPVGMPASTLRSCDEELAGFPCDPGEVCASGTCRRPCEGSRGTCPPGESCDYYTVVGTDFYAFEAVCRGSRTEVPIPEPDLFDRWAVAGHATGLAGDWAIAVIERDVRAMPVAEDGTFGDAGPETRLPKRGYTASIGVVGGKTWVGVATAEGQWLGEIAPDGRIGPWVWSLPGPTGWATLAGDRLLTTSGSLIWSAVVRDDGTLGPWQSGLLPTTERSFDLGVSGGILWVSERTLHGRLYGAPVAALPNPVLAWRSESGWHNQGIPLAIPAGAAVVVSEHDALAIFAGPEPAPGVDTSWRQVHRSDVPRRARFAVGDDEGRIWAFEDGGDLVWTTRWSP